MKTGTFAFASTAPRAIGLCSTNWAFICSGVRLYSMAALGDSWGKNSSRTPGRCPRCRRLAQDWRSPNSKPTTLRGLRPQQARSAGKVPLVGKQRVQRSHQLLSTRTAIGLSNVDSCHCDPRVQEPLKHPFFMAVGITGQRGGVHDPRLRRLTLRLGRQ